MIPIPAFLVPWLWRLGFGLAIATAAGATGWTLGAQVERGRAAAAAVDCARVTGRIEQRQADVGEQVRQADADARDRQARAAAAARAPVQPSADVFTQEITRYVPTETDECRATAQLLRGYHAGVVRLRDESDAAQPGAGDPERAVPEAGGRPAVADPAP